VKTRLPEVIISADGEPIRKPIPMQPALAGVILILEGQEQIRIMYGITQTAIATIRIRTSTIHAVRVLATTIFQTVAAQQVVEVVAAVAEAVVVVPLEAQVAVETKRVLQLNYG
jgi:hypothetical protein